MNGLKRLCLKKVLKNYVYSLQPSVVFLYTIKSIIKHQNTIDFSDFLIFKKTEKICYQRLPLCKHCLLFLVIFSSCFSFFPHLIYLPGHILDKKMGVIWKKEQKIVTCHRNRGVSVAKYFNMFFKKIVEEDFLFHKNNSFTRFTTSYLENILRFLFD